MKIVITGAGGLIGWHAAVRLHAFNCTARFKGEDAAHVIIPLDHVGFNDDIKLTNALKGADAVLHFAGVNRASDAVIQEVNAAISRRLIDACHRVGTYPHIVYANSTHAEGNTVYGHSKRVAGEILSEITEKGGAYTDLVLPHIFGECARPRYNNVTATFIEAVINGESPDINPNGTVALLHAGAAAKMAIEAVLNSQEGTLRPEARNTPVLELFETLKGFHTNYSNNIFPNLSDTFTVALFNSYRAALYPDSFPRPLKVNTDARGMLVEAVKGGGGGQTFFSTTEPGITRGDHFHLNKVERFLVLQGEAVIRIRKALSDEILEYHVSGTTPAPVDMPTLYTHSIENVGTGPLTTLFWTHDLFDPSATDTYFDPVLKDLK